jgi:hypothetical protein
MVAMVGYQEVHLSPGQLVFGRKKCSKTTGISERAIRSSLNYLKTTSKVTIKVTSKYSIISIMKWDNYQFEPNLNDHQSDHQGDQQTTSKRPASDHIQECTKKVKNVKKLDRGYCNIVPIETSSQERESELQKPSSDAPQKKLDPEIETFVSDFIEQTKQNHKNRAPKAANLFKKSYETIEKLIRIDGYELNYIFNVISWASLDDFWSANILSLASLRSKRHDGLTKFQKIDTQYRQKVQNTTSEKNKAVLRKWLENEGDNEPF